MNNLLTSEEVAMLLDVDQARVSRHALKLGVRKFGMAYMFTKRDLARVKKSIQIADIYQKRLEKGDKREV